MGFPEQGYHIPGPWFFHFYNEKKNIIHLKEHYYSYDKVPFWTIHDPAWSTRDKTPAIPGEGGKGSKVVV